MKDMDAMILAVVRHIARAGTQPARDLVVRLLRRRGGRRRLGRHWLVDHHPELFEGATEAISEVGGYSSRSTAGEQRAYLLQTAEKGIAWMRLRRRTAAPGTARCSTTTTPSCRLAEAVARLGRTSGRCELHRHGPRAARRIAERHGPASDADDDLEPLLAHARSAPRVRARHAAHTANPTLLEAGYKHNVIPRPAEALIDVRFLPGHEDESRRRPRARRRRRRDRDRAPGRRPRGALRRRPRRRDGRVAAAPTTRTRGAPVLLSGGTDNKSLARLGIRATASRRCGCPPTSTSPACSTASTSACRRRAALRRAGPGDFLRTC